MYTSQHSALKKAARTGQFYFKSTSYENDLLVRIVTDISLHHTPPPCVVTDTNTPEGCLYDLHDTEIINEESKGRTRHIHVT